MGGVWSASADLFTRLYRDTRSTKQNKKKIRKTYTFVCRNNAPLKTLDAFLGFIISVNVPTDKHVKFEYIFWGNSQHFSFTK